MSAESTPRTAGNPDPADNEAAANDAAAAPELGYEQARAELARVVERLESGAPTLEESLQLWERGEYLAQVCQRWLDGARSRLDAAQSTRSVAD